MTMHSGTCTPAATPAAEYAPIYISVLGHLRVQAKDRDITPASQQLRKVLALLVIRRNKVVPIAELEEELWEGTPPKSSATAIQTYIMGLRKMIATNRKMDRQDVAKRILITQGNGYTLHLASELVDVSKYEDLAARGSIELADNRPGEAAWLFREALSLWSGEPLSDIDAGRALDLEVTRLNMSRATALELRINADLRLGRHYELLGELTFLAELDSYNETLQAQLLVALHRSGRRIQALAAYQRFRQALVEEFGLEPSHNLRDLHQAILEDGTFVADPQYDHPALAGAAVPEANLAGAGAATQR